MRARHVISLAAVVLLAGCGGSSSSPSSPTAAGTTSSVATVQSCSAVSYKGATETVRCSIPGQSIQPSAVAIYFGPGRTDCLFAMCSNGCVSSVRVGAVSGNTCQ